MKDKRKKSLVGWIGQDRFDIKFEPAGIFDRIAEITLFENGDRENGDIKVRITIEKI